MTLPPSRISDNHVCPMVNGTVPHVGGPVIKGQPTVLIGNMPAARIGDNLTCVGPPDTLVKGSATTLVGNMPQARIGDTNSHGGSMVVGCMTCLVG
ncbi:MAG: PAAR domain-containing protein [Pseudomonadota bacterium]